MGRSTDVWLGTLAVMVLKTLDTMGQQHGYGIGRRIEQTSGGRLVVNYGTLYPCLLKLEEDRFVSSAWGVSENGRRARYYAITRSGRKHLAREAEQWERTTEILARFLRPGAEA
jgi:PadR family transcriptional regulator PadR